MMNLWLNYIILFSFVVCEMITAQGGDAICAGKGTLGDRIRANLQQNDPNNDSVGTGSEIFDDLSKNYDVDQDGCLSKKEWVDRWVNFYKFSPQFAEFTFFWDESKTCPLDINSFKTDPNLSKTTKDEWIQTLISSLVSACNADPTSFTSNCDCAQLRTTCETDVVVKTNPACVSFLACDGKGQLQNRFLTNLRANDKNNDKIVTGAEVVKDLNENYDNNNDGCVDKSEWMDRWTNFYRFSGEYSENRFNAVKQGRGNATCPIDISFFQRNPFQSPTDEFMNRNVKTLIDLCRGGQSLNNSNCDCLQLGAMCLTVDYFKDLSSCQNFVG